MNVWIKTTLTWCEISLSKTLCRRAHIGWEEYSENQTERAPRTHCDLWSVQHQELKENCNKIIIIINSKIHICGKKNQWNNRTDKCWAYQSQCNVKSDGSSALLFWSRASAGHVDILKCYELISARANVTADVFTFTTSFKTASLAYFNVPYDSFPILLFKLLCFGVSTLPLITFLHYSGLYKWVRSLFKLFLWAFHCPAGEKPIDLKVPSKEKMLQ